MGPAIGVKHPMSSYCRTAALLLTSLVAPGLASAAPVRVLPPIAGWFYPDTGPERAKVDAQGRMNGIQVVRSGVVMAEVTSVEAATVLRGLKGVISAEAIDHKGLLLRLDFGPNVDDYAISRALRARPEVRFAHPDLAVELVPHAFPNDPYVGAQWHLENVGQSSGTIDADIDAEAAWAITRGAGIMVSTIDSGVDDTHPDLTVTCGYDYVEDVDGCYPLDLNAHGTAAAGLSVAIGDNALGVAGVAYEGETFGVRLIGGSTTSSDFYNSFESSVDAGAAVLNNSWGYADGCGEYTLNGTMRRGIEYADDEGRGGLGTSVVFSAGNGNCDISGDGLQAHPTVISVAAVDHHDRKQGYSSFGQWMDVAAPSGGVLTTDIAGEDGYGNHEGDTDYTPGFSGTSASAPIVSGALALMYSANADLTANDARVVLCATADKVQLETAGYDESGWSPTYGCGRINVAAAVFAVANSRPGEPTPTGPEGDPYADRIVLRWDAASDVDGDRLTYRVEWTAVSPVDPDTGPSSDSGDTGDTPDEEPPEPVVVEGITDLRLDITEQVEAGQQVTWTVQAADAWALGEAAEGTSFEVMAVPEPPEPPEREVDSGIAVPDLLEGSEAQPLDKSGCAVVSATGGAWVLGLVVAARRREY